MSWFHLGILLVDKEVYSWVLVVHKFFEYAGYAVYKLNKCYF